MQCVTLTSITVMRVVYPGAKPAVYAIVQHPLLISQALKTSKFLRT